MKQKLKKEQFTIQIHPPIARSALQCINIYENGDFTLNGKLAQTIHGQAFLLAFTSDARALALIPAEKSTETIQFPKSGRKRIPDVSELLKRKKIVLPAQYEVWFNREENFWQGDLAENPTKEHSKAQRKPAPKSKKN